MALIGARRVLLGGRETPAQFLARMGWTGSSDGKYISPLGPAYDRYWSTIGGVLQWVSQATYDAQFVATSTAARSYFDASGVLRNDLVANQPRYSYESPRGQVLENAIANLLLASNYFNISHMLTVTGGSGTFIDGESVSATGGGSGSYISGQSSATVFAIKDGAGTFTGTLTGGTSGATKTISSSAVAWARSGSVTLSYGVSDPFGGNTATTMTAGGASQYILQNISSSTGVSSIWIRRRTGSGNITLRGFDNSTSTIISPTSSWTRYTFPSATGTTACVLLIQTSGDAIDIYSAQPEAQSFASHYIPTTTAAVSRAIETDRKATAIEALLSGDFAVFVDMKAAKPFGATARRFVGGSSANYLIGGNTSNETGITAYNGSTTLSATLGSGNILTRLKASYRKSAAGRAICANGGTVAQDTTAGTNTKLYVGRDESNTAYGDGIYYAEVFFPASAIGMTLGSELILNGNFDTDTVWSKGAGWAIGSGVATASSSSANLAQSAAPTVGTIYAITYTITRTAGSITPQFIGGTPVVGTSRNADGTYTDYLQAVTGNDTFRFGGSSFSGTVDNVSVRPVTHAFDARMPTLTTL